MTIHVNSILEHLRATLAADPPLSGFTVEVGLPVHQQQHTLPWVGLWYGGMTVAGHTISANLASGRPWRADPLTVDIYHQAFADLRDGTTLLTLMEHQFRILTAVSSNPSLDGTVLLFRGVDAGLFDFEVEQDEFFLTNLITLSYEVRG